MRRNNNFLCFEGFATHPVFQLLSHNWARDARGVAAALTLMNYRSTRVSVGFVDFFDRFSTLKTKGQVRKRPTTRSSTNLRHGTIRVTTSELLCQKGKERSMEWIVFLLELYAFVR